jgi:hypothetical protein
MEIREDKLVDLERDLAEREARLAKKEEDLAAYVGQLQNEFDRRETDWWEKQLGKPLAGSKN